MMNSFELELSPNFQGVALKIGRPRPFEVLDIFDGIFIFVAIY